MTIILGFILAAYAIGFALVLECAVRLRASHPVAIALIWPIAAATLIAGRGR